MQLKYWIGMPKIKKSQSRIFSIVCLRQFNKNLQAIAERANWVESIGKQRLRNGKRVELYRNLQKEPYRFCDLLTSHVMRRTAITTMLMSGVQEHVVRKISGHSANSLAFYRYVNYTQTYLDIQIDKMHKLLQTIPS